MQLGVILHARVVRLAEIRQYDQASEGKFTHAAFLYSSTLSGLTLWTSNP